MLVIFLCIGCVEFCNLMKGFKIDEKVCEYARSV